MTPRDFTDPLGSRLPALERCHFKLRAMQMVLVMFYAEQLKRKTLNLIRSTDRIVIRVQSGTARPECVPKRAKRAVDRALNALVMDRAITPVEKAEIVELIDYRNAIGHQVHHLMADLCSEPAARRAFTGARDHLKKYDYKAVARLQHFHRLLDRLYRTHHYIHTVAFDGLLFGSAERAFHAEIKLLDRRILRLTKIRLAAIDARIQVASA